MIPEQVVPQPIQASISTRSANLRLFCADALYLNPTPISIRQRAAVKKNFEQGGNASTIALDVASLPLGQRREIGMRKGVWDRRPLDACGSSD
jgi:hypothetical protein